MPLLLPLAKTTAVPLPVADGRRRCCDDGAEGKGKGKIKDQSANPHSAATFIDILIISEMSDTVEVNPNAPWSYVKFDTSIVSSLHALFH